MNISQLPSKFRNLVLLENDVCVPPCLCLGAAELSSLFENFAGTVEAAGRVLDRIARTSGAFLAQDLIELDVIVQALTPAQTAEYKLSDLLRSSFGSEEISWSFAVRSANVVEDCSAKSFAGLYETFLDIRGSAELLRAVRKVWLSAYSRAVVTERIHGGLLDGSNPMNVIIQRMVPAKQAGVAFSRHPVTDEETVLIEIVEGYGDSLVSGRVAGHHYEIARTDLSVPALASRAGHQLLLERVLDLLQKVERRLGSVDIEWAWDGQSVWLLQARPITSVDRGERSNEPVLFVADLYGGDEPTLDRMRPLPDFISYFRDKRTRIAQFARRHDLGSATALVVRLNGKALDLPQFKVDVLDSFGSEEVILDFSAGLRQIILPRYKLADELKILLSDPGRLHTIVVRDFIRGDAGIITQAAYGDGTPDTVIGEWSLDGLLAINRGIARTQVIRLEGLPDDDTGLPGKTAQRLYGATLAAGREIGPVQIEWVKKDETLYPLDFSALSDKAMFAESGNGTVISRGYAFASTLVLDDDRDLELLSIAPSVSLTDVPDASEMGPVFESLLCRIGSYQAPPIIVSRRPLAALAPILPFVSGFVFERAAILSHLSILIRERGLPAVQSPEIHAYARSRRSLLMELGDQISISSPDDGEASRSLRESSSSGVGDALVQ